MNISDRNKVVVIERNRTTKVEDMVPWKEAHKQFKFKDKG